VFGTSNRATPTRFRELPVGLVRMNREIMEGRGTPELHALPGMCRAVASTPALPPPRGRVRSCRESARKPSASQPPGISATSTTARVNESEATVRQCPACSLSLHTCKPCCQLSSYCSVRFQGSRQAAAIQYRKTLRCGPVVIASKSSQAKRHMISNEETGVDRYSSTSYC
jgi:hypothetical protein